ncbi:hypothetical protein F5Y17DRAFT_456356 [Xylariaceae sp. FL0594]|nr:hypothetical protein F5Y17DRAFT_456356 [Xylariaceae sp. FL0594]
MKGVDKDIDYSQDVHSQGVHSQQDGMMDWYSSDTHLSECTSASEDNDSHEDDSGDEGPQTSAEKGGYDDDDTSASEMSSVYEELDYPSDPTQYFERVLNIEDPSDIDMQDESEEEEEEEEELEQENGVEGDVDTAGEPPERVIPESSPALGDFFPKTQPFLARTLALNQSYERAQWRLLELEEMKRAVEREIAGAEEARDNLSVILAEEGAKFAREREELDISTELWDEYTAFCESMEPEPGSVTGRSIECAENHNDSYVRPRLYELAVGAVRDGSEAAMELLIALPDQHASFKGGWLFEYSTADPLKSKIDNYRETDDGVIWANNLVQSRRWHYHSAHKVEVPVDAATKRTRLVLALRPETVTYIPTSSS